MQGAEGTMERTGKSKNIFGFSLAVAICWLQLNAYLCLLNRQKIWCNPPKELNENRPLCFGKW